MRQAYVAVAGEKSDTALEVAPALVRKTDLPATPITFDKLSEAVPAWAVDAGSWPKWITALEAR